MRAILSTAVAVFVGVVACKAPAAAQSRNMLLIVVGEKPVSPSAGNRVGSPIADVARLDDRVLRLAANVAKALDDGQIHEDGSQSPPDLQDFSDAVLASVPDILDYRAVHVVSGTFLPLELVRKDGRFIGDMVSISHEFDAAGRRYPVPPLREIPLSSYVIEAAMPMPDGLSRASQDIVQVALELDRHLSVDLHLNPTRRSIQRALARDDVSILHIDTHGSEKGNAIQVTYGGDMMLASEIPRVVPIPLVLLFGCEGVADRQAFGSVMRQRGAEAVISSFAKFVSFGLTGDASRERRVYEAFFAALRSGENVGSALLRLRRTAKDEMVASGSRKTLTRHFFVLVGNQRLRFKSPASRG